MPGPVGGLVIALARLAVLLGVAATGSGCNRSPAASGPEPVLLWHTFNPAETSTLEAVLRQARTGGTIDFETRTTVLPFGRAQNEFVRAVQAATRAPGGGPAAGTCPDLFRAELPWVASFVDQDLLLPLDDEPAPELPAAALAAVSRTEPATGPGPRPKSARRYGIPHAIDCLALCYDRAAFAEARLEPPASLEALTQAATHLTRPGRHGFFVRGDAYWFLPFLFASGGRLFDPATGQVQIDEPVAVEALRRYRGLVERGLAPGGPVVDDYGEMLRRFGAGEVAMILNGPWAAAELLASPLGKRGQLGIAPFPAGPGGPGAPQSGHAWVVPRCAPHRKDALRLLRHLTSAEVEARFARERKLVPARADALRLALAAGADPVLEGFARACAASRPRPVHAIAASIFDDFNPAVRAVVLGEAQPEEALAGVAMAWKRLLAARPAVAPPR
jgi:arabinogalactan oligomer/maltooligosaccharide transport system substrate-binding protein